MTKQSCIMIRVFFGRNFEKSTNLTKVNASYVNQLVILLLNALFFLKNAGYILSDSLIIFPAFFLDHPSRRKA